MIAAVFILIKQAAGGNHNYDGGGNHTYAGGGNHNSDGGVIIVIWLLVYLCTLVSRDNRRHASRGYFLVGCY